MSRAAALVAKVTKRPRVTEAQLESAARVALEQRVRITIAAADKTWTIEPALEATEQGRSLPVHVAPQKVWRL